MQKEVDFTRSLSKKEEQLTKVQKFTLSQSGRERELTEERPVAVQEGESVQRRAQEPAVHFSFLSSPVLSTAVAPPEMAKEVEKWVRSPRFQKHQSLVSRVFQ